jgi:hypothetical protein
MIRMCLVISMLAALAWMPQLQAEPKASPATPEPNEIQAFLDYQTAVRERFEEDLPRKLNRGEWSRLKSAQRTIFRILERQPSMDALTARQSLAVFNAQEEVAALVSGNERDRLICRLERPSGSNIPVRRCMTFGEIELAREAANEAFMKLRTPALGGE